jgi:hypothetical protein
MYATRLGHGGPWNALSTPSREFVPTEEVKVTAAAKLSTEAMPAG